MNGGADAGRGFTLIELLITLAIVSIITTMAVGGYRSYLLRANRVDATATLLRIAAAQEKFYVQNGRYADTSELAEAPPAGLGIAGSAHGYYTLSIEIPDDDATRGFLALASAVSDGPQHDDDDCASFGIDERGRRSATTEDGSSGAEVTARCWR